MTADIVQLGTAEVTADSAAARFMAVFLNSETVI